MTIPRNIEGAAQAPVFKVPANSGDGEGNNGHIPISLGFQAAASMALLEMQENYVKISQLQREATILTLKDQQGPNGTVMAIANAIQASADADKVKDYLDGGNELAQAAGAAGTAWAASKGMNDQQRYNEADTDLQNTQKFETAFNAESGANRNIGNAQANPVPGNLQARYDEIVDGRSTTLKAGDDEVFKHVWANGKAGAVTARINQAKLDANTTMNAIQTGRQANIQRMTAYVTIAQHLASAGLDGGKGWVDANRKGPADAVRTIAQSADQNVSQAASQTMDQAKATADAADQLNRIREALAQNSATPGQ